LLADAHFYEDVMTHGHPDTYDDAILESGNKTSKDEKRILFWTSATQEGDVWTQQRRKTVSNRRTGVTRHVEKTVTTPVNRDHVAQAHVNKFIRQTLAEERERGRKVSAKRELTQLAHAKERESKRAVVMARAERLDGALSK